MRCYQRAASPTGVLRGMKKKKRPKKFRKKEERARMLLTNLAQVLDACDKAELEIKVQHGIIVSMYGYVLPLKSGWTPRMLDFSPLWGRPDLDLAAED